MYWSKAVQNTKTTKHNKTEYENQFQYTYCCTRKKKCAYNETHYIPEYTTALVKVIKRRKDIIML
jgi:hypothetical protein